MGIVVDTFANMPGMIEVPFDRVAQSQHDFVSFAHNGEYYGFVFADGKFDNWCVYLVTWNVDSFGNMCDFRAFTPKDVVYFQGFVNMSTHYEKGLNRFLVWTHCFSIYNWLIGLTDRSHPTQHIMDGIKGLCDTYYDFDYDASIVHFMLMYFGMLAEENKAGTKLGARIKMEGITKCLIEYADIDVACNCQRGKSWKDIECDCYHRGIFRF